MKIKLFTGRKKCNFGETYNFKEGVAEVPGFRIGRQKVFVNFLEFKKIQDEECLKTGWHLDEHTGNSDL